MERARPGAVLPFCRGPAIIRPLGHGLAGSAAGYDTVQALMD